jgi:hypothetical protein
MSIVARFCATLACGVVASLSFCGVANAQFGPIIELPGLPPVTQVPPPEGYPPTFAPTAVGTYFAPSVWSPTLAPTARFVILSNFNSDAVLDRETGLVWARQSLARTLGPSTQITRNNVGQYCRLLTVGNRKGWRLPTVAELQSLVDRSRIFTNAPRPPAPPAGHPFVLSPTASNPSGLYWTGEAYQDFGGLSRRAVDLTIGRPKTLRAFESVPAGVDGLCVRGGAAVPDDSLG